MNCAEHLVEACARNAWKVDLEYRKMLGDEDTTEWEHTNEEDKATMRDGVIFVLRGVSTPDRHRWWVATKEAEGWTYGSEMDAVAKTNPLLVPFESMPAENRVQETLFEQCVLATVHVFWTGIVADASRLRTSFDPPIHPLQPA